MAIDRLKKAECCGCNTCVSRCPVSCITMKQDAEGFRYPEIDSTKCIDCNLCERVCQSINPSPMRSPADVVAAVNVNDDVRLRSSSGGIFYNIAKNVIARGGVVFGMRYDAEWNVVADCTETADGLEAFMESKYLQARIGDAYRRCREMLDAGRIVLFTGTPCHIAGLLHYLPKNKRYDSLYTVDVICHGVPSPGLWTQFLREITNKKITYVNFRDKSHGWHDFRFVVRGVDNNNKPVTICDEHHTHSPFMTGMLRNLTLRPSCYACSAKDGRSGSDATIGDLWGVERISPEIDDDKGVSLIMVNDRRILELIDEDVRFTAVDVDEAVRCSAGLRNPSCPDKRPLFWSLIGQGRTVERAIEACVYISFKSRLRNRMAKLKRRIFKS